MMQRLIPCLFAALMASRAVARPDSQRVNVREACRQAVAGAYLKVYDERERLKTYMRALAYQLKDLEAAAGKSKGELARLERQAKETTFEVSLATRRDEAAASVGVFESQIAEAKKLRSDAATSLDQQVAAEKELRVAIERVFTFQRMDDKPDGGYPLTLTYKSDCPKYRYLCSLPAKDVDNLKLIRPGGKLPEECERYAGLSRLR